MNATKVARFIKISAEGDQLEVDATEWAAVHDMATGLMWSVEERQSMAWKKAGAWVKKLRAGGFKDWRLPTVEELFLLADRTKVDPAIDKAYFPDCKSSWYWSGTPYAGSPGDFAWIVYFGNGGSYWGNQGGGGYVRAVRASQLISL